MRAFQSLRGTEVSESWRVIRNGPTSSTARVVRTKSAVRRFLAGEGDHRRRQDGRGDAGFNPRLRLAVDKAKGRQHAQGQDRQRAIKKGTGELEGVSYEEIRYEGYGIGGSAVMVDCPPTTRPAPWPTCATPSASTAATWAPTAACPSSSSTAASCCSPRHQRRRADGSRPLEAGAEDVVTNDDGSIEVHHRARTQFGESRKRWKGRLHRRVRRSHDEATERHRADRRTTRCACRSCSDAIESLDDVQAVYLGGDGRCKTGQRARRAG